MEGVFNKGFILHIKIAISWSISVLLVHVGPLRILTHSTCEQYEFLKPPKANKPLFLEGGLTFRSSLLKGMGRGFTFCGFIVKGTGRSFKRDLSALI